MKVLIVEDVQALAEVWKRHLLRELATVHVAHTSERAIDLISANAYDVVIMDLVLGADDSALAVADYAQYRRPDAKLIFVTDSSFFSDGSIFQLTANAHALLSKDLPPDDLVAMVEHYGSRAARQRGETSTALSSSAMSN